VRRTTAGIVAETIAQIRTPIPTARHAAHSVATPGNSSCAARDRREPANPRRPRARVESFTRRILTKYSRLCLTELFQLGGWTFARIRGFLG
jgi:hypothetical protein